MEARIKRLIRFIKSKFEDGITVLWSWYYEYIEIDGISDVEFATVMKETNGYE